MTTTIAKSNIFQYNLVNSFGDGHNHELNQYEELCSILMKLSDKVGLQGRLLGNVMCGSASLDSLLLTPFGVFVIEFKSYGGDISKIRIDGQKRFLCLNSDGIQIKDKDGNLVFVKGGTHDTPYTQAKINHNAVLQTLKKCFPDKNVEVGVIIVFKGKMQIEGLDHISDKWLSVIGSDSIVRYMSDVPKDNAKGLSKEEIESFVLFLDANKDVAQTVNSIDEVKSLVDMGRYDEAKNTLKKCDPIRKETILLSMKVLFCLGDSSDFVKVLSQSMQSKDDEIRDSAFMFWGKALSKGSNGFEQSDKDAINAFSKVSKLDVESMNLKKCLSEKIQKLDLERRQKEARQKYRKIADDLLRTASEAYEDIGRVVSSIIVMIIIIFGVSIMLPYPTSVCMKIAIVFSYMCTLVFCFMFWHILEDGGDFDLWYIRSVPAHHFRELHYRLIEFEDDEWLWDRLIKTIAYAIVFFIVMTLPFVIGSNLLYKILSFGTSTEIGSRLCDFIELHTSVNLVKSMMYCIITYFVLNLLSYAFAFVVTVCDCRKMFWLDNYDHSHYCYSVAVPELFEGGFPALKSSLLLCKHAMLFGIIFPCVLCILVALKSYIYMILF